MRRMQFTDRSDAGRQLARALAGYRGQRPLVLAIPRGAVPMGELIAAELGGELDVVLVRKIGAPWNEEFAIGAVDESGWTWLADYAASVGGNEAYVATEREHQLAVMQRRRAAWTPLRTPIDAAGRVVIVVDDGLATGATMVAALHGIRARGPARLVCAVPVASPDALERVTPLADEVVCLHVDPAFQAVGQYFLDFRQVTDEEVADILARGAKG